MAPGGGTPRPNPSHPHTSGGSKEEFEALTAKIREAQFRNYTSFEEEPELARGEIQRCIDAEHMTEFRTIEEVAAYVGGKPLLNRLALQVKTQATPYH